MKLGLICPLFSIISYIGLDVEIKRLQGLESTGVDIKAKFIGVQSVGTLYLADNKEKNELENLEADVKVQLLEKKNI